MGEAALYGAAPVTDRWWFATQELEFVPSVGLQWLKVSAPKWCGFVRQMRLRNFEINKRYC